MYIMYKEYKLLAQISTKVAEGVVIITVTVSIVILVVKTHSRTMKSYVQLGRSFFGHQELNFFGLKIVGIHLFMQMFRN